MRHIMFHVKFLRQKHWLHGQSRVARPAKIYPIDTELDAWYFGNILLGGVIGMLIVDPATGAMYKLSTDYLHINMENSTTATEPELRVYDLTMIPAEWHEHLEVVIP